MVGIITNPLIERDGRLRSRASYYDVSSSMIPSECRLDHEYERIFLGTSSDFGEHDRPLLQLMTLNGNENTLPKHRSEH